MKILAIISMTIKQRLSYRGAVWFGIIASIVSIIVYYYLWAAVFLHRENFYGYTFPMIVTYVVLSRIIASQFSGGINGVLAQWVYDGTIAAELLRPVSLMGSLFSQRLGELVHFMFVKALPLGIVISIILGVLPPSGWLAGLLFTAGIFLSVIMLFFIEFIVGLLSFYTLNYYGVIFAKDALLTVLSGGLVPLVLFPDKIRKAVELLPFKYLVSIPVNTYIGILSPAEALHALGLEAVWTAVLAGLGFLLFRKAIKKVTVQGG